MLQLETYDDVTRIHMFTSVSRSIGYSVSAYLVRGTLIDVGFPAVGHEVATLLDQVRPEGVLITHHHEDHAGNVELVARRALPLAAAEQTLVALRTPESIGLYRRVIWGAPGALATPVRRFESDALTLVHTPGHSQDHHVVWDAERETVFAGDLFLGVKVRVAHPAEEPRQLARSLRAVAALKPKRMFDAHRGLVPKPVDALLAKADWLEATIAAVETRIARGWRDRPIARDVLGREELAHYVSLGKMSRINFVRAVRRAM
jgi:endoribonuclease LACTB2